MILSCTGAGHIQAAGHLPMRLLRGGNARDAAVGGAAVQRWMGEAQLAQRGETSSACIGNSLRMPPRTPSMVDFAAVVDVQYLCYLHEKTFMAPYMDISGADLPMEMSE